MDHTARAVFSRKIEGRTTRRIAVEHTLAFKRSSVEHTLQDALQVTFTVARGYSADRGGVLR